MMLQYRLYQPATVNSAILVWQHFAPLVSKFGNTSSNKVANWHRSAPSGTSPLLGAEIDCASNLCADARRRYPQKQNPAAMGRALKLVLSILFLAGSGPC